METQAQMAQSPPNGTKGVATGFEDDYIRALGDDIAALTPREAGPLKAYIEPQIESKDA